MNGTYRHEALLWHNRQEFLATTVPFIRDGFAGGDQVMIAVISERAEWLRDALGHELDDVVLLDMRELGRNPARIISAWQGFLDEHCANGGSVRGIGEPLWAGRRPAEVAECQLLEGSLYRGSHLYGGRDHVDRTFATELPQLGGSFEEITFARQDLHRVSSFVAVVKDPMTGRRSASNSGRNGLWLANQRRHLVQLRSTVDGTTVRVHHWLSR